MKTVSLTVGQFIFKIKKVLLELKDEIQDKKRDEENCQKILLMEGLKLGSGRLKLLDLTDRSIILPYQERYEYVLSELQKRRIPDWRNHLLTMVKESLKQKLGREACIYMTSLSEFERYFRSTYIIGQNLVQDLLPRLFDNAKPYSYEDSNKNITSSLIGMKILKAKKLEKNLTDIQLEMLLSRCLLNSDQAEYFREFAKEKSSSALSSTLLDPGDEEEPIDFNKTISDEVDLGTMEVRREFLTRCLVRKQAELSEILNSKRTRKEMKQVEVLSL